MGAIGGPSSTFNPYLYVRGNPTNLTDPSGEFAPLVAILVGAAAGAGVSAGINLALQIANNLINGRDATECIDMGSMLVSAIEGAVMGGLGGGVGALGNVGKFRHLSKFSRAAGAAVVDFAVGIAWDTQVYGDTPTEALFNNVVAFGVGFGLEARSWKNVNVDPRSVRDSGRVRTSRRSGAEGAVDLSQRRAWYSGDNSPDLSAVTEKLRTIFDLNSFHPTKFKCTECADQVAPVLRDAGFDVDYVQIQPKNFRGTTLYAKSPNGGEWEISQSGFHEVVRINHNGTEYFIDSLSYQHHGVQALIRDEYRRLWGIDAPMMVYFHSRNIGMTRSAELGNRLSIPNRIFRPDEISTQSI